ncbi:MAG TPA: hypothetical protein VJQ79_04635 [Acidimicrobiia bacterium]|nr:hypothetical protein [Acidimicrobiia bacterium]
MPEFQGKMRLSANPFDLVGADIEVSEGSLALIVSDHEIGEWPLEKVAIDSAIDGFHMTVDGEQFVFTTAEADAFAAAVGISRSGARRKKSGRSPKTVKSPKARASLRPASLVQASELSSISTKVPSVPAPPPRSTAKAEKPPRGPAFQGIRSLIGRIDLSNPQGKIGFASAVVAVVLAVVARPILAGILLFIGMAGVLLIGAASVDPLLATRLPEGWPTRRLVVVSMAVIVSGLLLVAF